MPEQPPDKLSVADRFGWLLCAVLIGPLLWLFRAWGYGLDE